MVRYVACSFGNLILTYFFNSSFSDDAGIEPWTFEQFVGEAVFIPAGCPHQVRNKKVNFLATLFAEHSLDLSFILLPMIYMVLPQ